MLIFLRIVLITYVIAINVYSYMLVLTQKKQMEERLKSSVKDAKLFIDDLCSCVVKQLN